MLLLADLGNAELALAATTLLSLVLGVLSFVGREKIAKLDRLEAKLGTIELAGAQRQRLEELEHKVDDRDRDNAAKLVAVERDSIRIANELSLRLTMLESQRIDERLTVQERLSAEIKGDVRACLDAIVRLEKAVDTLQSHHRRSTDDKESP